MTVKNIANPAPLGLAGFGFTTILLNLVNAGFIGIELEYTLVLTMGLFFGGLCQLIAGHWSFKLGSIFPATAFTAYGAFWLTFAIYLLLETVGLIPVAPASGIAAYLFLWGIFTFYMWINSFYHDWNLVLVFGTLWILFIMLGVQQIIGGGTLLTIIGLEGILCGALAVYTSFCYIFKEHSGISLPGMGTPLK